MENGSRLRSVWAGYQQTSQVTVTRICNTIPNNFHLIPKRCICLSIERSVLSTSAAKWPLWTEWAVAKNVAFAPRFPGSMAKNVTGSWQTLSGYTRLRTLALTSQFLKKTNSFIYIERLKARFLRGTYRISRSKRWLDRDKQRWSAHRRKRGSKTTNCGFRRQTNVGFSSWDRLDLSLENYQTKRIWLHVNSFSICDPKSEFSFMFVCLLCFHIIIHQRILWS